MRATRKLSVLLIVGALLWTALTPIFVARADELPGCARDANSRYLCGTVAYEGRDYQTALRFWRPLAEQGEGDAQYRLGHMHREGEGVLQNFKEALKWYRLAISTGNAAALIDLGEVYADGMSVTQEYVRAHMWFNLAASKLSPRFDSRRIAVEGRDKVAAKMTAVQIERAQEMARKCQESKFKDCGW